MNHIDYRVREGDIKICHAVCERLKSPSPDKNLTFKKIAASARCSEDAVRARGATILEVFNCLDDRVVEELALRRGIQKDDPAIKESDPTQFLYAIASTVCHNKTYIDAIFHYHKRGDELLAALLKEGGELFWMKYCKTAKEKSTGWEDIGL